MTIDTGPGIIRPPTDPAIGIPGGHRPPDIIGQVPTLEAELPTRMAFHFAVLEANGVSNISALGQLDLTDIVKAGAGLLLPNAPATGSVPITGTARRRINDRIEWIHGNARVLATRALKLPTPAFLGEAPAAMAEAAAVVAYPSAYWVGTTIRIADNTVIVFPANCPHLVILCENLVVGNNVTFSWERSSPKQPPQVPRVVKLPKQPMAHLDGVHGARGRDGMPGAPGFRGADAPLLEVWALRVSGRPAFDLRGEDGGRGGAGQDGQDGQDGSDGSPAEKDGIGWCRSGPGNAGNGGDGGNGGSGGQGGAGGQGGHLIFYAPQPVLQTFAQQFWVDISAGSGGEGGPGGAPGTQGSGGRRGQNHRAMGCRHGERADGAPGQPGRMGAHGPRGTTPTPPDHDSISLLAIDEDAFQRKLLVPLIAWCKPERVPGYAPGAPALVGESIVVYGRNFTASDQIEIEGARYSARMITDGELRFTLPKVRGGPRSLRVVQSDGTRSNAATVYVQPQIREVIPATKFRPGLQVSMIGSGFAEDVRVFVNDQEMQGVRFVDSSHIQCPIRRPSAVVPNPLGEQVRTRVMTADGRGCSNDAKMTLDTFRVVVLGDSILWGQGLRDHEKIYRRVATTFGERLGNIGMYCDLLAHSGAIIGIGDDGKERSSNAPPLYGEVNVDFPTILEQCARYTIAPETVDLVLIDGGINDVGLTRLFDPTIGSRELSRLTELHCGAHMETLLKRVAAKFRTAAIVATGYYRIISPLSNVVYLPMLLEALLGCPLVLSAGVTPALMENCRIFAETARGALFSAVSRVNAQLGGPPRIVAAVPPFGDANVALGPDPLIYGVNYDLSPQDTFIREQRKQACAAAGDRTNQTICQLASAGHPNARGAEVYANTVLQALQQVTVPVG